MSHGDSDKPRDPRLEATVRLSVPFCDVDAMQVVWHGNYFKYFERARQALFDQVGLNIYNIFERQDGYFYPVVRSSVKYLHPLRHRDVFQCRARLKELSGAIKLEFEVSLLPNGPVCAWATADHLAVDVADLKPCFGVPDEVRRAFGME